MPTQPTPVDGGRKRQKRRQPRVAPQTDLVLSYKLPPMFADMHRSDEPSFEKLKAITATKNVVTTSPGYQQSVNRLALRLQDQWIPGRSIPIPVDRPNRRRLQEDDGEASVATTMKSGASVSPQRQSVQGSPPPASSPPRRLAPLEGSPTSSAPVNSDSPTVTTSPTRRIAAARELATDADIEVHDRCARLSGITVRPRRDDDAPDSEQNQSGNLSPNPTLMVSTTEEEEEAQDAATEGMATLDLAGLEISPIACVVVCETIAAQDTLGTIDLRGCKIEPQHQAARTLLQAIQQCKSIRSLKLSSSSLDASRSAPGQRLVAGFDKHVTKQLSKPTRKQKVDAEQLWKEQVRAQKMLAVEERELRGDLDETAHRSWRDIQRLAAADRQRLSSKSAKKHAEVRRRDARKELCDAEEAWRNQINNKWVDGFLKVVVRAETAIRESIQQEYVREEDKTKYRSVELRVIKKQEQIAFNFGPNF